MPGFFLILSSFIEIPKFECLKYRKIFGNSKSWIQSSIELLIHISNVQNYFFGGFVLKQIQVTIIALASVLSTVL